MFKKYFKAATLLLTLLLFIASFISCSFSRRDDGNKMVFYTSHRDDIKTWDPANAYDTISLDVVPAVYETLYQYDYLSETYKIIPLLAADMPTFSLDKLTVKIPIKRGVKFQDDPCFKESNGKGRELKAQDFVYAFKRLALPALQSQGWWILDGKIVGINAFHDKLLETQKTELAKIFSENIEGIKAIDDYTLQLKLIKPYPQLMYILAMSFTAPVAEEAVKVYADEQGNLTDHPVGTGPFILKTWDRGRRVFLEKNPNHHAEFYPTTGSIEYRKSGLLADAGKPLPFLDQISINVVKEQQPAWLNFMKGLEDIMGIPKDNFQQAIVNQVNLSPELASKGIRLHIETGVTFYFISLNMKDKLIGVNKFLRQAISSAIDREKWIEIFTNGRGRKAVSALPPGVPDRPVNSNIKYDYNLARAKELLKKAGYPEGKGLPPINFDMRGADSVNRQMGEFFTKQFSAIGIKLNVIYNTFPAFLEKSKQGDLQISYGGWAMDYPDPENVYQLLYGANKAPGPNDTNFDHPEMNKLYEKMSTIDPGPKRADLIMQMDALLQEECPWALGYYHSTYAISQAWLLNYRGSDIITNKYKYYRIDKSIKKRYRNMR